MTVILQNEYVKLLEKKVLSKKELLIKKTHLFSKKNDIKLIYKNIDFLTVKLFKDLGSNLTHLENKLCYINSYQDIKQVSVKNIINKIVLFDKFFIVFAGLSFGKQKKIYDLYDFSKNKVGQIIILNTKAVKTNRNVINSIEFKGLFFKSYQSYLEKFYEYFDIDIYKKDILKRLDYCLDIKGIEVFQLEKYLKDHNRKSKNVIGLTATDVKELQKNIYNIKYGKTETYINFLSNDNDLKLYDKILELISPKKIKRKVDGVNPYQDYINSSLPITRIEVKKKKFNYKDNSLNRVFQNIEALFFDYLIKHFSINLSLYIGKNISLNGKKIFLAKEEKAKSLEHSLTMAKAYLSNINDLSNKNDLFRFIYSLYPELETIKPLDLLTDFEVSDFFNGITDKL